MIFNGFCFSFGKTGMNISSKLENFLQPLTSAGKNSAQRMFSLCTVGEQFIDVCGGLSCVMIPNSMSGKIKKEKRDELTF